MIRAKKRIETQELHFNVRYFILATIFSIYSLIFFHIHTIQIHTCKIIKSCRISLKRCLHKPLMRFPTFIFKIKLSVLILYR